MVIPSNSFFGLNLSARRIQWLKCIDGVVNMVWPASEKPFLVHGIILFAYLWCAEPSEHMQQAFICSFDQPVHPR